MKGNIQDIPVIAVILFATGICVMFLYLILSSFLSDPVFSGNAAAAATLTTGMSSLVILGNSFIFLFVGFGIASVIASFYTETHPIFFIFSIFTFAICVIVVAIFSDVFVEMASSGVLLPVAAEFTIMVDTMTNLKTLAIGLGVVILVALYAKRNDIQIGGGQA